MTDKKTSLMTLLGLLVDAKETLELIKAEEPGLSEEALAAQDATLISIKDELFGE